MKQLSFDRNRFLLIMDEVEIALQLADLSECTKLNDQEVTRPFAFYTTDFKSELYSVASMVLDFDEIEAFEKKSP